MNSEREKQITSIFHAAIEREPHDRVRYLSDACGGDEALRHDVEALIKSHESAGSFIAQLGLNSSLERQGRENVIARGNAPGKQVS